MVKKFDMREFVLKNLYDGYCNGSFSYQQVSIFATNYSLKGIISQHGVVELMAKIDAYIEEPEKKTEEVEEPTPEQETEPEENLEA